MPSLRMTAPGQPPTVYHLHKKITSLGSSRDNDIVLPDPLVPDGFAIHFDGQTYTVFAPKKTEFVVNGKKRSKHKLSHDERLTIGSVDLRWSTTRLSSKRRPRTPWPMSTPTRSCSSSPIA
jgi:hypothetical protein